MKYLKEESIRKTIIVGVLLFIIFELMVSVSGLFVMNEIESDLTKKTFAVQNEVDKLLLNVFTITDAYQSFLEDNPDATKTETEEFLNHLMEHELHYVRNIAYVEGTTIKYNYPYEENITSIGVDLSVVEGQSEEVNQIVIDQEPYFLGPTELVQGGQAFIIGVAVVEDGNYIGHIATVIDADRFFDLLQTEADKFNISLTIDNYDGDNVITIGDEFPDLSVTNVIENNYFTWEITAHDLSELSLDMGVRHGIRTLGLLVTILVCYYVYKNSKLNIRVRHKAHHDSLTNDYNRSRFIDDYESKKIEGRAIAFTDINKFKVLNDTLGHHFGDWALNQVSKAFNGAKSFITYRNSGDEFILVSKEKVSPESFIEKINNLNLTFYNKELKRDIEITLSVGVIKEVPKDLLLEDMLIYLDYAMYDAKKNNLTMKIVDEELMVIYKEQKKVEQLLIDDIKEGNLITYYQPIINTKEKRVEGVEVLSRWIYKDQVVSAAGFIDVAKKIRYIEIMDQNLLNNLQKEYIKFDKELKDISSIQFAVNLSAESLKLFEQDPSAFDRYLSENIIPSDNLMFEISEDINLGIISNDTLEMIKNKGYRLVIDDFGSGVSKLTDVLSGKLHAIKTDKGMLPTNLKEKQNIRAFNTIIRAINATNSKVVIEGVETKDQLKICMDAGCNVMQGYLFAKPMSFEDVVEYINTFDYEKYVK